jgi:hypothetical protein
MDDGAPHRVPSPRHAVATIQQRGPLEVAGEWPPPHHHHCAQGRAVKQAAPFVASLGRGYSGLGLVGGSLLPLYIANAIYTY